MQGPELASMPARGGGPGADRRAPPLDPDLLARLAPSLRPVEAGLWRAAAATPVSYPDDGNRECFEIEDGSYWFRHRNEVLALVLERFPPPGALFDVGGGNGFVARGLAERGHAVVVVEPGADGVRNALARGLDPVIHATFEDAGFLEASLPAVGLFDVVEHIRDDVGFLALVRSRLRAAGRAYLSVPAHAWLWSREDETAGHFRRYSRHSLAAALSRAGLELEYATHFFRPLVLPILLLRSLPSRCLPARGSDPERVRAQHRLGTGIAGRWLDGALRAELGALSRGAVRGRGASLVAVARRPS